MFKSARIKLTAWYLAIVLTITGSLSLLFYRGAVMTMKSQFDRIERRLELLNQGFDLPPGPRLLPADLEMAKKEIARQLIMINSLVALVFGGAGYVFAGRTLKPIEEAMEKQKRFVSDASHELKTPLTALKTAIEVDLRDKKLPSQSKKMLKSNLDQVNNLAKLVNDLLKLARRSESKISFQPVVLKDVVDLSVDQALLLAKRKKIDLKFKLTPKKAIVLGQQSVLDELLAVFLDNAIKYTGKNGKVYLEIVSKKSTLEIAVKDNGVGIAKKDIGKIFDRFYRVDPARSKTKTDGFGLGLSLAKEVVDQLGGSISVESKLGKGTTFRVKLPFKRI